MAKRRLTEQQSRRVRANRERRADDLPLGEERRGRVIARFSRSALVEDADGAHHSCQLRANLDSLVTGDAVRWIASDTGGVVTARETRTSEISRPDMRGRLKPIAANIDLLLIVVAPKPEAHANLIDRYLIAAHASGIQALIVINKSDLLTPSDPLHAMRSRYEDIGEETILTGLSDPHAEALRARIGNQTIALVGQSGVGKSSLVNRLLPDVEAETGMLSEAKDKGRHTTTTTMLYRLDNGGALIDSPGIREFNLHHLPESDIAEGFREFRPLLGRCKFRDCRHLHGDDCAIRQAVDAGSISVDRYESFCRIVAENAGG